jgi:hypothetical protein
MNGRAGQPEARRVAPWMAAQNEPKPECAAMDGNRNLEDATDALKASVMFSKPRSMVGPHGSASRITTQSDTKNRTGNPQ